MMMTNLSEIKMQITIDTFHAIYQYIHECVCVAVDR